MKKIFVLFVFISTVVLSGCTKSEVLEVKETSEPAEYLIQSVLEVYSTFDILDDFISSHELLRKKDELLIPNSVVLVLRDSSFTDGDGIDFSLDFGELGHSAPYGVLCKDNKYRAGRIDIEISANYKSSDAEVRVKFGEQNTFYSGDGNEMQSFNGELKIDKKGESLYHIETQSLTLRYSNEDVVIFSCNNSLEKTEDYGIGILNDQLEIDGSFYITTPQGVRYEALINQSLKKNYISGCVKNIVAGKIEMDLVNSASEISADFDPYEDQACDNVVELTINNKSFIYEY